MWKAGAAALAAVAITVGMIAVTFTSCAAKADTPPAASRSCVTPDDIAAQLGPMAEAINTVGGTPAQALADAISAAAGAQHYDVAAVVAFIAPNGNTVAIGFDADGCMVVSGMMTLDVFNAARAAAGLAAIVLPAPAKPPDNSI